MAEPSVPNRPLTIDEFVENDWFNVRLVTDDEFVTVGLKTKKRESVLRELSSGSDPVETLKANAPLGQPPAVVPLSNLKALEWHGNDSYLTLRYFDTKKNKLRSVGAKMSSSDARTQFIERIKQVVGECEYNEEAASIWYIGLPQLIYSAFALLFFGALAIGGYMEGGPVDVDSMGRGRAFGALYNAVGSAGLILIGLAIATIMMIWWYLACRTPPVKSIETLVRSRA